MSTVMRSGGEEPDGPPPGLRDLADDWAGDQETFRHVHWGKAMMWIFLLSDTFIFSSFLVSYMTMRTSVTDPWPNASEVFALTIAGRSIPLRNRKATAALMFATAMLGATFVSMQAFEWSKLIGEGVRPWTNPWGAEQFGASFFMITGFHGLHVSAGVIMLLIVASKVLRGHYDRGGDYSAVEIAGLYWHFVDLVWVFIFAFFYLW
jgi:cytochrome c oxidase subunit 3